MTDAPEGWTFTYAAEAGHAYPAQLGTVHEQSQATNGFIVLAISPMPS